MMINIQLIRWFKVKYIINANNTDKNKVKIKNKLIYIEFLKVKKIKFHKKQKLKKRVYLLKCSNFNRYTLFYLNYTLKPNLYRIFKS